MDINVIIGKRDGKKEKYNSSKILNVIKKSTNGILELSDEQAGSILNNIEMEIFSNSTSVPSVYPFQTYTDEQGNKDSLPCLYVEQIQDMVESFLSVAGREDLAHNFIEYRRDRTENRQRKSTLMQSISAIGKETDRDNANVGNNFSSKMLRIASESNKVSNLMRMPKYLSRAHENGDLYYHDLDSYNLTTNCLHIPTKKLLTKGFNTGYGTINKPHRIVTATEHLCITMQSCQNDMFGGQSHPNFDNDLAPFLLLTKEEVLEEEKQGFADREEEFVLTPGVQKTIDRKVNKSLHQAMQAIVYNLNTMHSRAGSQVPFSSVNIGTPESEEAAQICQAFLEEYDKGLGKGEQPIFPNIIFRVKKGVNREDNDPYFYLFKLACKVAGRRMNPTFMNIDADFNKEYYDKGYLPATMGCRTYLMSNVNGDPGTEGRGNIAPTTINLVRIGILAKNDWAKFYELLYDRLSKARESLLDRYGVLKNLRVKDLPFVAGQHLMKGSEGLDDNDSIEPILKQGTWGIGFIGLAETLIAMMGVHHGESEEAEEKGIEILSYMREFCDKMKIEDSLNWSLYATPAEGLSGKFIKKDKQMFGEIAGVTDKDYYTNSFHVPVYYSISIASKVEKEAPFHKLCNGGHISYIELDDYATEDQVMSIIRESYRRTNISYMGINFHMRYCKECGTFLHNELKCPHCDSTHIQGISRVTGYLSLDERFGEGKTAERADRTSHNGQHLPTYVMNDIKCHNLN